MERCALRLALIVALAASVIPAQAQGPPGQTAPAMPVTGPAGPELARPRQIDPAQLAAWGISGRIVTGKMPTLTIALEPAKVVASWEQIRASGLVGASGSADWARAHPVTACKDAAVAALPPLLREIYQADDTLDYTPVYAVLGAAAAGSKPEPLFTLNVNRRIARKLDGAGELSERVAFSPWLEAQLRREQR